MIIPGVVETWENVGENGKPPNIPKRQFHNILKSLPYMHEAYMGTLCTSCSILFEPKTGLQNKVCV